MADYADPTDQSEPNDNEAAVYRCLQAELGKLSSEVAGRNGTISQRDDYIYGDRLERSLDIPIGHDFTPVNWLRRTVEIHKIQFMGRPFQVLSTYDTADDSTAADEKDKAQKQLSNKRQKALAELRKQTIDAIIRDNGGHSLFANGAESASAVGDWVLKAWFDEDAKKVVLSPVEAVENCWALWNSDNFRSYDLFAYAYQISPQEAADRYGITAPDTSPLGAPMVSMQSASGNGTGSTSLTQNMSSSGGQYSNQPMVTVLEATGKIPGYGSQGGKFKEVTPGNENELNVVFIGGKAQRVIDDFKKLPRYYVFPNKVARRRAWGVSDISDAAININATYVETLSDWRTVQMKVNFPKFRGFNFGPDTQMPKMLNRKVQFLPLGDGQDVQPLQQGDANALEFKQMLDELKEQFVRETGISRVLFDDPSITLNSNQALLTSMKPTSDIAEGKKQLWAPILTRLFDEVLHLAAANLPELKDLVTDNFGLKVQWPSIMNKEDPIFQQMLLNRKNAGVISVQTYLEMQGETNEEVDRIRDEMSDPVTAGILGNQLPLLAESLISPPQPPPADKPTASVSIKGETIDPDIRNLLALESLNAQDRQTEEAHAQPGNPAQVGTTANNQGGGPVSQPGSGASGAGPQGALDQANQNAGG